MPTGYYVWLYITGLAACGAGWVGGVLACKGLIALGRWLFTKALSRS